MGREIAKENDECGTMNDEQQEAGTEARSQEPEYKAESVLTDSLFFPFFRILYSVLIHHSSFRIHHFFILIV
jgi:hypothetical protein